MYLPHTNNGLWKKINSIELDQWNFMTFMFKIKIKIEKQIKHNIFELISFNGKAKQYIISEIEANVIFYEYQYQV